MELQLFPKEMKDEEKFANRAVEPVWCLVANVKAECSFGPGGEEKRAGTKHFSGGTKVYCFPMMWGDGLGKVKVVGRHRGSSRLVTMVLPRKHLTSWRAQLVYKPALIAIFAGVWEKSAPPHFFGLFKKKWTAEKQVRDYVEWIQKLEAQDAQ